MSRTDDLLALIDKIDKIVSGTDPPVRTFTEKIYKIRALIDEWREGN